MIEHYIYYDEGVIDLKTNKIFIVFIAIFLILVVGCSKEIINEEIKNEGNKIVVDKRVGEVDKYEYFNEIDDAEEVQKVKDILDNISWENIQVSMVHPPDYKFHFEDTYKEQKSNGLIYELWISPYKNNVELVAVGKIKYIQLNREKSAELFKIIIGKDLADG